MSNYKRFLLPLSILLLLLSGLGYWLTHRNRGTPPAPSVLPEGVKAIVVFDESKHELKVTTKDGIKRAFARKPEVRIHEDGTITTFTHSFGFIRKPFLGVGYSDAPRLYVGVSWLYFKRFDFNTALGLSFSRYEKGLSPAVSVGYNVYSGTGLNLGVNPLSFLPGQKPEIHGYISVKF